MNIPPYFVSGYLQFILLSYITEKPIQEGEGRVTFNNTFGMLHSLDERLIVETIID
jgi:hypothetical protein